MTHFISCCEKGIKVRSQLCPCGSKVAPCIFFACWLILAHAAITRPMTDLIASTHRAHSHCRAVAPKQCACTGSMLTQHSTDHKKSFGNTAEPAAVPRWARRGRALGHGETPSILPTVVLLSGPDHTLQACPQQTCVAGFSLAAPRQRASALSLAARSES